jgi:cell wall-associated NlpC family hydrolase
MTTTRTSLSSRPMKLVRRGLVTVAAGAGVLLSPLPAFANTAPPPPSAAVAAAPAPTAAAQTAVNTALAQLGKPYVWGAAGPGSYDCSGLVLAAYRAAGISLPHSSSMQSTMGRPVAANALQPGDLVFFYSPVSHVAMYIGNGQIVQASTFGKPVAVTQLSSMPGYAWARRIA